MTQPSRIVAGSGPMPTEPRPHQPWGQWKVGDRVRARCWADCAFLPGVITDARPNEWVVKFDDGATSGWLRDAFIDVERT